MLGFREDGVGVGDGSLTLFSPRSESWDLKKLDIASPELRTVCCVPGLKRMLRSYGGKASARSVGLACWGAKRDNKGAEYVPGLGRDGRLEQVGQGWR